MSFNCHLQDGYIVNLVRGERPATSNMSQVENELLFSLDEARAK